MLVDASGKSMAEILDEVDFNPPAKLARTSVDTQVAACLQPSRRCAPSLLPEGRDLDLRCTYSGP